MLSVLGKELPAINKALNTGDVLLWLDHFPKRLTNRRCERLHVVNRDVSLASLYLPDVGAVQTGLLGKKVLGE